MTEEIRKDAQHAIRQLQAIGRPQDARHLEHALGTQLADAFPLALRESCQTVLPAIESIDPNTEMLLEQLRAKVDALLTPKHPVQPDQTDTGNSTK